VESLDSVLDESDEELELGLEDDYPLADFELFARRRLQEDFTKVDSLGGLRSREIDYQYNWSAYVGRYEVSPDIWK
jgi:hypothetical protein